MRLINIETFKLEEFLGDEIPPYVILSHTWGKDADEVSFRDFEEGRIEEVGRRPIKLEGCCVQAKRDGFRYAWIDTCCINRTDSTELSEAINSMFRWYGNSAVCYAYLSDVPVIDDIRDPKSKFSSSRWFGRGWTLQELLAPRELRFYISEWSCLGTRGELAALVERITGISRRFLHGVFELGDASVAERMAWAARRETKRKEDIAYCLLGIFDVMMPMIYGEGDGAFIRLQEKIIEEGGDDSILAWDLSHVGEYFNSSAETVSDEESNYSTSTEASYRRSDFDNSTEAKSGGSFAAAPSDFRNCARIASRAQRLSRMNTLQITSGFLQIHLPFFTNTAGKNFGLLNCGPRNNTEVVVGIPLIRSATQPESYIRPREECAVLLPKAASKVPTKLIRILNQRQSKTLWKLDQRRRFYVEETCETNLELVDVRPRARWQKEKSTIYSMGYSNDKNTRKTLTRFRYRMGSFYDFVVVLENSLLARYHVMISSRDTSLEDIEQNLSLLRQEFFGKQRAYNGILNLFVTLEEELSGEQKVTVVKLVAEPSPPKITVNITLELRRMDLSRKLAMIQPRKRQLDQETKELEQTIREKTANIRLVNGHFEIVEAKTRKWAKLYRKRSLLIDEPESIFQEVDKIITRQKEVEYLERELFEWERWIHQQLKNFPEMYFKTSRALGWRYELMVKQLQMDLEDYRCFSTLYCGPPRKTMRELSSWHKGRHLSQVK